MLNWPLVFHGPAKGGIAGYTQALALELSARGHRVSTIASGTTYRPASRRHKDRPGPCSAMRHPDWFGIGIYEIANSPVLAPSLLQFNEPAAEVSSPELEAVFEGILRQERPDALHVQSLEGFSLGCLEVARRLGCRVVYSLHNYHPLCPQVYLMQGHRTPCTDYRGGHACQGCVPAPDPQEERRRWAQAHPDRPTPFDADRPSGGVPLPILPTGLDGAPSHIDRQHDTRGTSASLRRLNEPRHWCTPDDPTWQPFENTPTAEPAGTTAANGYAARRQAFIEALNRCHTVHAVSSFVAQKFIAHGVEPERVKTITIGTVAGQLRQHNAELAFPPPPRPTPHARPLRAVFIGVNHWYKGLSMLADSLEMLTPEVLAGIDLSVFAAGGQSIEYRFRRLEPRLASLRYGYEYGPQDVPWMCGGQDVGLVTSVWWDNGPQTVLEMQANDLPIIGARAGGIPDFVHHEVSGLLFRANDRFALSAALARCVREPDLVARLRRGVRPPKTIALHAEEMEPIYAGGVS